MGVFSPEQPYFGVDISNGGVRVVQLAKGADHPLLIAYGDVELDDKLSLSDAPEDVGRLSQVLKKLVVDAGVSINWVVIGLPTSKVFATVITTPKLSSAELAKAISFQAERFIPMNVAEAKLDWVLLGPGKSDQEQHVLLVAASNLAVNKYEQVVEQAGLELLAVEPNVIALSRAVLPAGSGVVMLVDVGQVSTDLAIMNNGLPHLIRSVDAGVATLTRNVMKALGLQEGQAEQFVAKFGLDVTKLEGQVFKAAKPTLELLVNEIGKSVQFFSGENPTLHLTKLILTGQASSLPGFIQYLSEATKLPVESGNPWINVSYPTSRQAELAAVSSSYGVAVGLAMRGYV